MICVGVGIAPPRGFGGGWGVGGGGDARSVKTAGLSYLDCHAEYFADITLAVVFYMYSKTVEKYKMIPKEIHPIKFYQYFTSIYIERD